MIKRLSLVLVLAVIAVLLWPSTVPAQVIPAPVQQGTGSVINVTDRPFRCTQPLVSYAARGLPLIINHRTSRAASLAWNTNGAVRLETGCRGDGNPRTCDLVLHIYGNGVDQGSAGDGLVLAGGDDIVVCPNFGNRWSWVECGGGGAQGGHEDAFRANRGSDLTLYRVRSGSWTNRRATCHGAGGNMYMDNVQQNRAGTARVVCIRCRVVASKGWYDDAAGDYGVGLGLGWSTDSGARGSCFMAVRPIFQYRNSSGPLSIRPIDVNNMGWRFLPGTNTLAAGQRPITDCPLV